MSARHALVTGGAGFIGGHLVEGLLAAGWRVRVLDDLSTGRESNLAAVRDALDFIVGDIRDPDAVAKAVEGVEVVFHQAAAPSVVRSVGDPLGTHAVNTDGTLRVLQSAREAGVRRVVYAASSSAYGDVRQLPKHEDMAAHPLSPYALQKLTGEIYCRLYHELYGMETVALRYFNVFGPRQNPAGDYAAAIPRFILAALRGRAPTIHGDGEQTRDFTYVSNVVRANLLAADAAAASGAVINVAAGARTSVNRLWRTICELVGVEIEAGHDAARPGEVRDSVASLERARELLGYEPTVSLREGLAHTVEALRREGEGT